MDEIPISIEGVSHSYGKGDLRTQILSGIDLEIRDDFRGVLEHCDRQRFAPPVSDPGEQTRFLSRAEALMTSLDRSLR